MSPARKHVVRAVLVCALATVVAPVAATAPSTRHDDSVPCWKRLLNDWYDGTINNIYPIPCYQQAIKHLPADLRIYGSAKDDILAARAAAIPEKPSPPEHNQSNTTTGSRRARRPSRSTDDRAGRQHVDDDHDDRVVTTNGTTTTTTTVVVVPAPIDAAEEEHARSSTGSPRAIRSRSRCRS